MAESQIKNIAKNVPLLSSIGVDNLEFKKLSGFTNDNFLVQTPNHKYILRVPRLLTNQNINRENEAHNYNVVQQLGVAPKCLWRGENKLTGASLTEYIEGAVYVDEIKKVAETIRTLQQSEKSFKGVLDNEKITQHLEQYFELCSKQQKESLQKNKDFALKLLDSTLSDRPLVPAHVDLVPENILQTKDKLWIIDWEYSAMASPFWDIAYFSNSMKLDSKSSLAFAKQVITDYTDDDLQSFENYRFITQIVCDCWNSAFIEDHQIP